MTSDFSLVMLAETVLTVGGIVCGYPVLAAVSFTALTLTWVAGWFLPSQPWRRQR